MSASNSDDDTLISQDDIDKLLSSSSLDEAEAAIGSSDDELGELSQDDIDSLLNNVSLDVDRLLGLTNPSQGLAHEFLALGREIIAARARLISRGRDIAPLR